TRRGISWAVALVLTMCPANRITTALIRFRSEPYPSYPESFGGYCNLKESFTKGFLEDGRQCACGSKHDPDDRKQLSIERCRFRLQVRFLHHLDLSSQISFLSSVLHTRA